MLLALADWAFLGAEGTAEDLRYWMILSVLLVGSGRFGDWLICVRCSCVLSVVGVECGAFGCGCGASGVDVGDCLVWALGAVVGRAVWFGCDVGEFGWSCCPLSVAVEGLGLGVECCGGVGRGM